MSNQKKHIVDEMFVKIGEFNSKAAEIILDLSRKVTSLVMWSWFHTIVELILIWKVFIAN